MWCRRTGITAIRWRSSRTVCGGTSEGSHPTSDPTGRYRFEMMVRLTIWNHITSATSLPTTG